MSQKSRPSSDGLFFCFLCRIRVNGILLVVGAMPTGRSEAVDFNIFLCYNGRNYIHIEVSMKLALMKSDMVSAFEYVKNKLFSEKTYLIYDHVIQERERTNSRVLGRF